MFQYSDMELRDVFCMLAMNKFVYDETGEGYDTELDTDYFYDVYFSALEDVAELIDRGEYGWDDYVEKFSFPHMLEYYDLCKEYGRQRHVSFKRNSYVRKAETFVNEEMHGIDSYCIDWKLFFPKKLVKIRYPCLTVFTTPEFYQPAQLIEALCNIRCFFRTGVEELKKELGIAKPPLHLLPCVQEEGSVAA